MRDKKARIGQGAAGRLTLVKTTGNRWQYYRYSP
jgi:hypothetical protein